MGNIAQFLLEHGYFVLFLGVFAEQIGLPLPSVPFLLAGGAMASNGDLNYGWVLALPMLASVSSDLIWYEIGRRKGPRVLRTLCRIALEPDSCVRHTEDLFARYGAWTLLAAKFVPGLNTTAPPLAGVAQMKPARFLALDTGGAAIWVGCFTGLGYVFADRLETIAEGVLRVGGSATMTLVSLLVLYALAKWYQRRRFLRSLRVARIAPRNVLEKSQAGEKLFIVDLRHQIDFEAEPATLPGALRMSPEELVERHQEIPRDQEIILYCS